MNSPAPTALIVVIPEVESLVGRFRARYDPASAEGVPAHVTVLYPFLLSDKISPQVVQSLGHLFATIPAFQTDFSEAKRFPGVLYLPPRPDDPFRRLTDGVFTMFPEAPPYGGRFSDVVPHLTVADVGDPEKLDGIAPEFQAAAAGRLPITAMVREVVLIQKLTDAWQRWIQFPLGSPSGIDPTP